MTTNTDIFCDNLKEKLLDPNAWEKIESSHLYFDEYHQKIGKYHIYASIYVGSNEKDDECKVEFKKGLFRRRVEMVGSITDKIKKLLTTKVRSEKKELKNKKFQERLSLMKKMSDDLC